MQEIPNLVAVKFIAPSFDEIQTFAQLDLPIRIFFLEYAYGFGSLVYPEFGYLASVTNCSYPIMRAYYEAGCNRDLDTILKIHKDFPVLYDALFSNCTGDKIDSAYDKLFLQFAIPEFPARILPPYTAFPQDQVDAFKAAALQNLPHWF